MGFIGELQRRNVLRMAGLYLVGAWLMVQVAATLLPAFAAPDWLLRALVLLLALGFVPALVFAWVFELTPEGLKREGQVPAAQSITPQTARRLDRAIIVVLALAVVYFAVDKYVLVPGRDAASVAGVAAPAPVAAPAAATEPSIAVLPFANLSADPEQAFFSDGLSEDLITALSQFAGLKVIGRNSSFRFRDTGLDVHAVGGQLGVAHLLSGSVRRAGDQVRISADLVAVADGRTLWSQSFDRPYADLFALQDEITAAVAAALKAKLLDAPGAAAQDDRPPGGNLDAYSAYLQGRFHLVRAGVDDYGKAMAFFEQALTVDPEYARALAGLANARVIYAANYLGGDEARASVARARAEIDRALAMAPDSAYVHTVYASVLTNGELRWRDADVAARKALALAPNDPVALTSLAMSRGALGDADGAEALFAQALDVDPLHSTAWYWRSVNLGSVGRLDEAEKACERALEISPESESGAAQQVFLKARRGEPAAAVALAEAMPAGNWRSISLAVANQRAGDPAAAEAALQALIAESPDGSAFQIAEAYAWRGDPDAMFEWLERSWTNRDPGLRRTLLDPFLAPYRGDPRFAAFCAKIGLPAPAPAPPPS